MLGYKPNIPGLKETIDTMMEILIKMDSRLNCIELEIKNIKKHIE